MLVIAAHPDDEDSGLLALVSRGMGAGAAYLSLSRGEGGQNLIGPELGVALGLIRTRELQAARSFDRAQQFFTRAYDFGFTRDLAETERFWPPDSVLKDVVRVVRRFRPQVIVAVFSGTPRDGHGQHQMSGVMARRAFEVAGDSTAFPELAREEGLAPWRPLKLYASARFGPASAATLRIPEGTLEPVSGQTLSQIAMRGRSQHRTQDFGRVQSLGPSDARLALEQSRVPARADGGLFDGIPVGQPWLTPFADSLRAAVAPERMGDAVRPLTEALARLRRDGGIRARPELEPLLEEAIGIAAGVLLDVRAERGVLVPGETVDVTAQVDNAGADPIVWRNVELVPHADGWTTGAALSPSENGVAAGQLAEARAAVAVPAGTRPTRPYFTLHPLHGAWYDWSDAPPAVRGLPDSPPPLTARFALEIAGVPVTIEREVTLRIQDQAYGEVREPLRVAPRIEVRVDPDTLLWPAGDRTPRAFSVTLSHHAADTTRGDVRLVVDGWPAMPPTPFVLTRRDEEVTLTIPVTRPATMTAGDVTMRAEARTSDGAVFSDGSTVLRYPHIRPNLWVRPAETRIRVAPVLLPAAQRIGYVRGASDRVPEALRRAGLSLQVLDGETLEHGDLSAFDVIVIGSRAYETDSALVRANDRVLAWVRRGGHLLVQYQQYPFIRGGFAPYPLEIATPHDRITDETSPVTILDPANGAFQRPNHIQGADWDGWPQERGLYFAHTWDSAYEPLLQMQDPGREPIRGGLLVAPVGKGTYIYTGLSFFRALPAGVPGAFRLFFNLLDVAGGTTP
jgi:LmbE family N-acetylglucosaminyl deacetylase